MAKASDLLRSASKGGAYNAPSSLATPPDEYGLNPDAKRTPVDSLTAEPTQEDSHFGTGALIAGGALTALATYLGMKYGIKGAIPAAARGVSNLRMTSMLSGLAAPKSALGNVGAAVNTAIETGSTRPLSEFFSAKTAKDWLAELKNPNAAAGSTVPGSSRYNPFGRAMGAGDVATRNALVRAGIPEGEAQLQTLQAPLPQRVAHALDSPILKHAIPFRRTPINQAIEGGVTATDAFAGPTVTRDYPGGQSYTANTRLPLALHSAAGAATGYATADDKYPLTPGAYAAFAGRYGAPALASAFLGRILGGGKGSGGLVASALPVGEYGATQGLDPRHYFDPFDPSTSAWAKLSKRIADEGQ